MRRAYIIIIRGDQHLAKTGSLGKYRALLRPTDKAKTPRGTLGCCGNGAPGSHSPQPAPAFTPSPAAPAHTHRLPVGGAAVQGSVQHPELPQGSHFVHRFWGIRHSQLPYSPAGYLWPYPCHRCNNISSASAQWQPSPHILFPHH